MMCTVAKGIYFISHQGQKCAQLYGKLTTIYRINEIFIFELLTLKLWEPIHLYFNFNLKNSSFQFPHQRPSSSAIALESCSRA